MHLPLLTTWAIGLALTACCGGASPEPPGRVPLAARFASPPAEARILKIIHPWPDAPAQQDELIRVLQAKGFGGVVCNVAFDQYLESDAKWAAFTRAVQAAKQAGMALWLYDEKGYPSGNAGGLTLRDHPEWEAQGLLVADTDCGPGPVRLKLPPGRLFLAAAFPLADGRIRLSDRIDLAAHVRDGELSWTAPAGRWQVLVMTESNLYEGTHAELNLSQKTPYLDLLRPEATARFLEVTHDRYAQHLGRDLGASFVATFTDEPSLMSLFLRRMPYRPLPWSPALSGEFRKRRGYALEPFLPALVLDAGAESQRHRYNFWLTVGELVSANFFGQIQTWCRAHQVRSGGHLLAEEGLTAHVALYGDFFRSLRRLDAPGIDCLTSLPPEVPWHIARLAASAAELDGHSVVMCETSDHSQVYRPAGDARPKRVVTEAEIRGTCNRLLVSGVNAITSYYSFTGLADDALRRLNEWVGRCATMLSVGHQAADVAVLYPIESTWTQFVPAHHWANASPGANRVEHLYRSAMESLFAARRDFTVVDSRTLAEAEVVKGELVYGQLRWRVVVLPGVDTLPLAAWKNLARFVEHGGLVVALGARPANSATEFPAPRVQTLAKAMFGDPRADAATHANPAGGAGVFLPFGSEALLPLVLDGLLEADVAVADSRAPLRMTHRRAEGHEVYFLINDSPLPWQGAVTCRATGGAELWDPATGERRAFAAGAPPELKLEPYGAAFLRFAAGREPKRRRPVSGALPGVTLWTLPPVEPLVARGEFVRETFSPDAAHSRRDRPAWQTEAVLTKSQVDTFLFVRLPYPQGLDLSRADFLELETWVPEGQRAPAQLLVILQEQDGGDFLATTPRSLSASGQDCCFVPLNRLQLAGWSKDGDGLLDLKRIREIRIGWGGYYGREAERVGFSFSAPRAGTATPP